MRTVRECSIHVTGATGTGKRNRQHENFMEKYVLKMIRTARNSLLKVQAALKRFLQ
jgi:hypothetical protein